jgi:hypothetical protein
MHGNDDIDSEKAGEPKALDIGGLVRVARLNDLKRVRAEISRLYREARKREGRYPDALTAQRLANVLGHVRTSIEIEAIEQRLKALEEKASNSEGKPR